MSTEITLPPYIPEQRKCFNCSAHVYGRYVRCVLCRAKNREKLREKQEKRRKHNIALGIVGVSPVQVAKAKRLPDAWDVPAPTTELTKSVPATYPDINSRPRTSMAQAGRKVATNVLHSVEYQAGSDLFRSLRGTTPHHFHGTYSIVPVPNIGKRQRVNIVVDNLRELAKIPFRHDTFIDQTSIQTFRSKSFTCLCRKACGGMIQVSVEEDNSHWLHIKGQKITVDIRHPDYNVPS